MTLNRIIHTGITGFTAGMLSISLLASACARKKTDATDKACTPPSAALARLRGYFTYYDRETPEHRSDHFSVVSIGDGVFFRHNNPMIPLSVPHNRTVYLYQPSTSLRTFECRDDDSWVPCAAQWEAGAPNQPSCEFELNVSQWSPSPDSVEKRKIGTDLLHTLGIDPAKDPPQTVYARDFNLDDPHLDFYIAWPDGAELFRGCDFDRTQVPYCQGWHLYGQAPRDELRQHVMELPYRLYPPLSAEQ
jgi:hypothetical protein